jgi:arginine exporter protein ArgO
MKTIYIVLFFAAAFVALFEQSTAHPNMFIMIGCIVIFMMGLMKLMSKVPSKHQQNNNAIEEENDV